MQGYSSRKLQTTFRKFYGRHTALFHIWGPHVGQELLTLSGKHDFAPFGEFMISPIHYINTLLNLSVLGLCLRIND